MTAYSTGLQAGFLTINDVRRLEDLRSIDDPSAETVRVPLANVNIEAANLTADDKKVSMAAKLITVGFDPEQVLSALGLAPMAHTGVPSVQLQNIALLDPADPKAAYGA
jgi:methenyltetrahydromethanopterin cyclohydrolase